MDALVENGYLEKKGNKYIATAKAHELNTKENERLSNPKNQKEAYSFHKQKLLTEVLQKDGKGEANKKEKFIQKAESKFGGADILEFRKNDVVAVENKKTGMADLFAYNSDSGSFLNLDMPLSKEDTVMGKFSQPQPPQAPAAQTQAGGGETIKEAQKSNDLDFDKLIKPTPYGEFYAENPFTGQGKSFKTKRGAEIFLKADKVKGIIKEHGAHSDQANSYFSDVLSKEPRDIQDRVKNIVMNDDEAYKSIVHGKPAQTPIESEEQGFNNLHPAAAIIGRENYDKLHSGKPIEVEFNDLRTGEPKTANITRNQSESGLPYYTVSDGKSSYDVGEKQWLDLVETGEYKVKEQSLIESQEAENDDDIYGYQESTKKPYSVKEQYGKKHYRIKGKDIPFDTDFSKDYTSTKEGDNEYFLRDSEGQVLRDNSEHPSALVFKTENAANSFVSAMNEIKKDNGIKSQATKIVKEPSNELTHEELIAKRKLENPTQLLDPSKPTDIRTVEQKKKSLESKHIRDVNPNELKGKAKAWAIEEKAKYAKEIEDWNNENPEHRIEL